MSSTSSFSLSLFVGCGKVTKELDNTRVILILWRGTPLSISEVEEEAHHPQSLSCVTCVKWWLMTCLSCWVILKKNSCDSGRLTFPNEMNGNSELNFYCTLKLEPRLSSSSSSCSDCAALYHFVSNFIILGWVEFWGPANAMMMLVNGGEESQFIKRLATKSKFIVGH